MRMHPMHWLRGVLRIVCATQVAARASAEEATAATKQEMQVEMRAAAESMLNEMRERHERQMAHQAEVAQKATKMAISACEEKHERELLEKMATIRDECEVPCSSESRSRRVGG